MDFKTLEEHNFFTETECLSINQKVLELREKWVERGGFYTLGAASYLDSSLDSYKTYSKQANPILQENFKDAYKRIKGFFEVKLGKPVVFDLAWPGFHVFEYNQQMSRMKNVEYLAGIHIDTPHRDHDWGNISINEDSAISFTIPVQIPKAGAGLNYYNINIDQDYVNFYEAPKALQKKLIKSKRRVDYKLGKLYCHNFGFLHQISNDFPLEPGDMRITIQGHGILCNDEYYTFFF